MVPFLANPAEGSFILIPWGPLEYNVLLSVARNSRQGTWASTLPVPCQSAPSKEIWGENNFLEEEVWPCCVLWNRTLRLCWGRGLERYPRAQAHCWKAKEPRPHLRTGQGGPWTSENRVSFLQAQGKFTQLFQQKSHKPP